MIKYNQPSINEDDINAVNEVLRTGNLTQGSKVEEFEQAICAYCGCDYAVALNSGTSALYAAYKVANGKYGFQDGCGLSCYVPANTFKATKNMFEIADNHYCVTVADINLKTGSVEEFTFNPVLDDYECLKVPVHFAGNPVDVEKMREDFSGYIIEDACHALGASYDCGSKVGSCKYSDMTVFSTHAIKTITTGEGGIVTTNNREYYEQLKLIRNHGSDGNPSFNFRMTDFQAALGISQLKRIDEFVEYRKMIASTYLESDLEAKYFDLPDIDFCNSSWHLFPVLLKKGKPEHLQSFLLNKGIQTQRHYKPLSNSCPNAVEWYERELSLPIHCELIMEQQDYVIEMIGEYYYGR